VPNHILTALHIAKFSELYLVGNKISEVDGLHRLLKLHLMKRQSRSLVPRLVENISVTTFPTTTSCSLWHIRFPCRNRCRDDENIKE
jgi:hypothetical protein